MASKGCWLATEAMKYLQGMSDMRAKNSLIGIYLRHQLCAGTLWNRC